MTKSLATVILPTHSDPGTLEYAISSIVNQTETRLEIIIVLDGATSKTKAVAEKWTKLDSRINILDLPKGECLGAKNRHLAVLSAKSEVIFYCDEDDLWLPNHVSLMLAKIEVEQADVVCSTVASVRPDGKIEIAPYSQAYGPLRDLLRDGSWRALFKIHMCHTKKCYEQLPGGWMPREGDEIVRHLMMELAAKQFTWIAINEVTALSFHGSPRRDFGISRRSRIGQIRKYSKKIKGAKAQVNRIVNTASIVHYLISVTFEIKPVNSNLNDYLNLINAQTDSKSSKKSNGKKTLTNNSTNRNFFPFTMRQKKLAQAILDFRYGNKISAKNAWLIYRSLTQIVCGPPLWSRRQGLRFLLSSTFKD